MNILETKNLTKIFGSIIAVDNLSISIPQQQVVAFIGPNGAGKTTLFNLCTGFMSADGGEILFRGRSILRQPPHKIARSGIARTFQDLRLIRRISVLDN